MTSPTGGSDLLYDEVAGRSNCQKLLKDSQLQEKLTEIIVLYFYELQGILHLASSLTDGQRPPVLTNEIYSCFHHIARGLCACTTVEEACIQCDKACKTHLKRATFDSYKLAINAILREDTLLKEVLDYLVLVEDYEKYIPDGIAKTDEINKLSAEVRTELRKAKRDESFGCFEKTFSHFKASLDKALDLRKKIREFTENKVYLLACAREAHERKERKKDRKSAIIAAGLSALLTVVGTLGVQWWLAKNTSPVQPQAVQQSDKLP